MRVSTYVNMTEDQKALIKRAAEADGRSVTSFMVKAATEYARKILKEAK